MKNILVRVISWLFVAVLGRWRWRWQPPTWASFTSSQLRRSWRYLVGKPIRGAVALVAILSASGALTWYATRPKPHYVTFTVVAPGLTEYNEKGISSIKPLKVSFNESAAPLKQLQKAVTTAIGLSPAFPGTWFWTNDKELEFTPKNDWPVDGRFSVRFAKKGFVANQVLLDKYTFEFKSQPFSAQIAQSQFYQDPQDANLKKLVATVTFSHPVDADQLERRVSLAVAKDADYLGLTPDSRHFTVAYDKFRLAAFIHSAPLAMPRDDTPMTLTIDKGVRAARGGNGTPDRLQAAVTIPGRTSLRFSDARMTVVDNARYEPEQILMMSSSSPVTERAFGGMVSVHLLPVRHPLQPKEDKRPYDWRGDENGVGGEILGTSEQVSLSYVQSETGGNTAHGFKFHAPVGRYLHLTVKDGIQGTGGYISGKPYVAIVKVSPYRRLLTFLGQGALLSLSGDKKVGFLSRDVESVDVEVGRVLPNQLQHLAPQMWDFSRPGVYPNLEDTLVERFTTTRDYSDKRPGTPTYDSIDLSQYLRDKTQARRGLFLLHVRAHGELRPNPGESEGDEDADDNGDRNQEDTGFNGRGSSNIDDTRLVLITDLGFIVKQAKDGSRDVFVQSIHSGLPVEGARIELVGTNGLATMAAVSDANGRAHLAQPVPSEARREKTPQLIVAQKDEDMSFMPFASNGRDLNLSRFDTGGVANAGSAQQLSTYLFTDRGIYRPGETTHLGVITRTADWKAPLMGLPITVEISDPRGLVVNHADMKLAAAPFDEVSYTSQASSPTGTYQATAYLVKENNRRETLGSTSFKVQEFEPDRLKVKLDLSEKTIEGWLRPDDVKARVTAAQLFGEAATNRRVEGELSLTPALPRFARYSDYRFQIGEALPEPYQERLAATVTDDKGIAEFKLDLKRFVGRAYRLNLLARVFEAEGGRNVSAQNGAIVSDAPFLVGVKADGDLTFIQRASSREARWLAVDQQLTPVAADGLSLEWVQRKFVSVLTQQDNRTLKYVSRLKEIVRDTKTVQVAAGGSNIPLPTQEPGDFVLILRNPAGAELNRLGYTVAGQANLSRSLERDTELQVQLDKPAYSAGDTIQVSIRAPYVGAGLITIERERVFQYRWFKTTTTSSVQNITLPADFEGNGYVSVQFLRDPSSDELFMSPLSYGVAAFGPNLSARTEAISLSAPRVVKPGATLTMRVTPGEPARVAVLAVDEGILQVARYKNPDPLGFFFQKRMLEVQTKQILDLILPEFKRFLALAAPGGDAEGGFARHLNPFARKRKPAVAFWSGVVDVGPEGRELKYEVPDYFNGRLRLVAVSTSASRMGVSEAATEVRGDFILTPNVPAMASPGDEFVVSAGVFNNSTGSGPIRVEAKLDPALALAGPAATELQIPEKKEGVAEFRVKVNAANGPNVALGSAALTFTARRGSAEAHIEETLSVRPPVPYRTQLTLGRLDGATAVASLTRDLYQEQRKVQASISALPLVWGQSLTTYLDNYPYLCTEQLVSKGMSAMILTARPEFGTVRSRDAQPLDATFGVLRSRANDEGGLGLWASSPITAEFPTVYAAHFLIDARDHGQRIPADVLSSLDGWLNRFASTPAPTLADGRLRAYAVYLLVRQGIKPTAALSNVEQELTRRHAPAWTTDLAAAYLASTYRLMQRNDAADNVIRNVPFSAQKRDFPDEIYYDPLAHDAQLVYLLARHFPARATAIPPATLETISTAVSGNRMNSLSAAYTLLGLDALAKAAGPNVKLGIAEVGKDGQTRTLTLPGGAMPRVTIAQSASRVQFSKDGSIPAYFAVDESGFDRNPPTTDTSQGMEIIREYVDDKGNPLTRITVGQEFFVRLRLRATSRDRVAQVAVVDLLPGGVEPVVELRPAADTSNAGVDPAQSRQQTQDFSFPAGLPIGIPGKSDWAASHVDVREDRVVLYGDVSKDAKTFVYRVRATSAGVFQTPPAFAEGMYNRTITGISAASKVEIVK
ncbi:MAG TPA: MG2 domain-containing protein [Vicinamibacterales bacterium]|nr:MG2 domain-containing protein [Vicinamibacterales bacterium]